MKLKVGYPTIVVATLMACAAHAADYAWVKPGSTVESMMVDDMACEKGSQHVGVAGPPVAAYGNPLGAALGAALVGGIQRGQAQSAYMHRCMRQHGYTKIVFTPEERDAQSKLRTLEDRRAWASAFYASDLTARIALARHGMVPALPEGERDDSAFGAIHIDPTAMTPATGAVEVGQPVLTGKVAHRGTATLRSDVVFRLPLGARASQGAVFQEVIAAEDENGFAPYWCGPIDFKQLGLRTRTVVCLSEDEKGYYMEPALGSEWLSLGPDLAQGVHWRPSEADFTMDKSRSDLLGPVDFEIVIKKLTSKAVTLVASGSRDGKTVPIWTNKLEFSPDGTAVLPFWSHRLVLTRANLGVTVTFSRDGNGRGWSDPTAAVSTGE